MSKKIVIPLVIGLSLVTLFLAKSYFDSTSSEENLGQSIAKLEKTANDVKYKHRGQMFWDQAKVPRSLYEGSEILTGSSSKADISFTDQTRLNIPAETLVKISLNREDPSSGAMFEILNGKVQMVVGQKPIHLLINGRALKIQGAEGSMLELHKNESGMNVSAISGLVQIDAAELKSGNAVAITVKPPDDTAENDTAAKSTEKKISEVLVNPIASPAIELLEPMVNKVFYGNKIEFFKWKSEELKNIFFEYSRTKDFSTEPVSLDYSDKDSAPLPAGLKPGNYYWRVVRRGDVNIYSETRGFNIQSLAVNDIERPTLNFVSKGKWHLFAPVKGALASETFSFQVSQDSGFQNIYDEFEGPSPLKTLLDGIHGDVYLRYRKVYEKGIYSDWSASFKVFVRRPLEVPALAKAEKFDGEKVRLELTWTKDQYAKDYLLEVSRTPKFAEIVKVVAVMDEKHSFSLLEPTETYIRIRARAQEGEISDSSNVFKVKGVLKGPTIEKREILPPLFDKPGGTHQLHLLWTHRERANKYRIELGRDSKLKDKKVYETDNVEFFTTVDPKGWHYFRVWSLGDEQKYYLAPTFILGSIYEDQGPLLTPQLFSPKKGETFLIPKGMPIAVRSHWSDAPGADWYIVEFSQSDKFTNPIRIEVAEEEYVRKEPLKNGKWYIRIKARNKYRTSDWSKAGEFYFGSAG